MTNINLFPVSIIGVGKAVPDTVIKNDDLAKLVETNDEWITSRTGIKERRVVSGNETCVALAAKAAEEAIAFSGVDKKDIDMIIFATSMPDHLYPCAACELQAAVDVPNATCFDLAAACSGSIFAITTAKQYIQTGAVKTVLVVGADLNSRFVDWSDRTTCVLFGDGAGAVVMQRSEDGVNEILSDNINSDGYRGFNLRAPLNGKNCPLVEPNDVQKQTYIVMNGKEVYKFAVKSVPDSVQKALQDAGITIDELDYLVPHQANIRIVDAFSLKLGLKQEQIIINLDKYGNTSAASLLIALAEAVESETIKPGHTIALCGFGAGLTWGSNVVKWRAKDKRK